MIDRKRGLRCLGVPALMLALTAPVHGAGFAIFEQGTRAMGMAMAFTARADDPSAMFYNVGGVAFQNERDFYLGVTLISLGDSTFQGAAPFPGPTETGDQTDQFVVPPHFYWVQPVGEKLNFGLGLEAPFGLVTEWDDVDNWSGRYISYKADLTSVDLNPSLGIQVNEKFGIGVGLVVRAAEVDLRRRVPQITPLGQPADVADVQLKSDFDTGVGFNIGILHKVTDLFQWGLAYRSRLTVEFGGEATFTQIPTGNAALDQAVAALLPSQPTPITTEIEFPDMASLGLGFNISDNVFYEIDANWTGWSSFDMIDIVFTDEPGFNSAIDARWDDAINVRTGVNWVRNANEWRFGLYYDETPQPDESVGPLLPDADRLGYTFGWGRKFNKFLVDLAVLWVDFDDRTTLVNDDNFNGTYKTNVLLVGASFGF